MDGAIVADAWEEAAKQYKPTSGAPVPAAASGNEDWKLWQQQGPSGDGGGGNVPLGDQPATFSGVARTMGNQAVEGAKGIIKGIGRSVADTAGAVINPMGGNPIANAIERKTGIGEKIHNITTPSNTAQTVGSYIPDAAMLLAPGGVAEQGGKLLPNVESAGQKFEKVFQAVGKRPVNIDAAAPAALRAEELRQAKFTTPPVMTRVLNRLSPGADPVGFREASDLATNAGKLSAAEKMSIKGPMQGQLNALARALRESNQAAADAAGVGDVYKSAVGEYRRAMKIQGAKDTMGKIATSTAAKWLAGAAGLGAGGYAARKVLGD